VIQIKGLFTDLFGSLKNKNQQTGDELRKEVKTLCQIGEAITHATNFCYKKTLSAINFTAEEEKQLASIHLYYEYLYLFRHLALRSAFARLPLAQMKILHEYVAGALIPSIITIFLKDWPEESKSQLRAEFFKNIDEFEVKYSASKEIFGEEDNALIPKVGQKIAKITGNASDRSLINMITSIVTEAYKIMQLEKLIAQAETDIYVKDAFDKKVKEVVAEAKPIAQEPIRDIFPLRQVGEGLIS